MVQNTQIDPSHPDRTVEELCGGQVPDSARSNMRVEVRSEVVKIVVVKFSVYEMINTS